MTNLAVYNQDGIEILVNRETGESFCSVSGYARMSGKAQSTIAEREKTYRKGEGKMSEVPTSTGIKAVRLVDEDQIIEWLPKDNPAMASKLMKLGVRMFLHQVAGYNPSAQPPQPKIGAFQERLSEAWKIQLPPGYWCVLKESMELLNYVESGLKLPVNKTDLLDGSIGVRWSQYRAGKEWTRPPIKFKYSYPDGRECKPNAYHLSELEHFRFWLDSEYRQNHLPQYLESKYGQLVKVA